MSDHETVVPIPPTDTAEIVKDGNYLMEEMPHHQKSLVSVWTHDATGERRVWGAGIGMFLADAFARGYKFTPLVLATVERIAALELLLDNCVSAPWLDREMGSMYEASVTELRSMLTEMKGEATNVDK